MVRQVKTHPHESSEPPNSNRDRTHNWSSLLKWRDALIGCQDRKPTRRLKEANVNTDWPGALEFQRLNVGKNPGAQTEYGGNLNAQQLLVKATHDGF
jgi:hypothetical protein